MPRYRINEAFLSIQGEGMRAGTPNVFIRFSGCNLSCSREREGFDCDTEFVSGREYTNEGDVLRLAHDVASAGGAPNLRNVIWTGGEPTLSLDQALVDAFASRGWYQAIETNGTKPVPQGLDWIACNPKSAEHALRVQRADELRYVRAHGQGIPRPKVTATHHLISPVFDGDELDRESLRWCMRLVKQNPDWRLSLQMHKGWRVR